MALRDVSGDSAEQRERGKRARAGELRCRGLSDAVDLDGVVEERDAGEAHAS